MPCFNQFRTRFIHARLAVSADMTRELFLDSITTAHSTFRMSVCTQQWHTREWRWKRLPAPPPPTPAGHPHYLLRLYLFSEGNKSLDGTHISNGEGVVQKRVQLQLCWAWQLRNVGIIAECRAYGGVLRPCSRH